MMAMRSLGSSPVAKSMKRVWVEEVRRKPLSSILIVSSTSTFGYVRTVLIEREEFEARLAKDKRECGITQDRYQRKLENVNAELMKLAREALDKCR